MAGIVLTQRTKRNEPIASNPDLARSLSRFALGLALTTVALMALGSATRVMNAGLSCPDWPLCYGTLLPHMNLQVFLEWFHRLVAASMGFGVITLVSVTVWRRRELPSWTPGAMAVALALVLVQGLLGGLTVTELLRFDIVTAHLGTGLAFFCTLLAIGLALNPRTETTTITTPGALPWVGLAAALGIYLQSLLGGLVASRWAVHQCFGTSQLCTVMNSHIAGVVPATLAVMAIVLWTKYQKKNTSNLNPWLTRISHSVLLLLLTQIALGITTYRLRLQVEVLTVSHQMVGALLLGSLVAFTTVAWRDRQTALSSAQNIPT
jgi:heme a synthase